MPNLDNAAAAPQPRDTNQPAACPTCGHDRESPDRFATQVSQAYNLLLQVHSEEAAARRTQHLLDQALTDPIGFVLAEPDSALHAGLQTAVTIEMLNVSHPAMEDRAAHVPLDWPAAAHTLPGLDVALGLRRDWEQFSVDDALALVRSFEPKNKAVLLISTDKNAQGFFVQVLSDLKGHDPQR